MAEVVSDTSYVTKDAFDIQVKSERADSDVWLSDARFDRLEALIAGNLAAQEIG